MLRPKKKISLAPRTSMKMSEDLLLMLKFKLKVIMISNQLLDQQKQTKLVDLFLKCP